MVRSSILLTLLVNEVQRATETKSDAQSDYKGNIIRYLGRAKLADAYQLKHEVAAAPAFQVKDIFPGSYKEKTQLPGSVECSGARGAVVERE